MREILFRGKRKDNGEWVRVADTYGKEYLCSACKKGIRQYEGQPICSECGAKMDGGKKE